MQADSAVTTELPKLNIPSELLTEVKRGGKSKVNYELDSMKHSFFSRLVEKLFGNNGR